MRTSKQYGLAATVLLAWSLELALGGTTNYWSPVVSYQYPESKMISPVATYQYYEFPGSNALATLTSPTASYFYKFYFPTVIAPSNLNVTPTTARLGGNINYNGDTTITGAGVVYSPTAVNPNPQIGGSGVVNVTSTATGGEFSVNATGLLPDTDYTFAAYASNSTGTAYSVTGSFSTNSLRNWLLNNGYSVSTDLRTAPNGDGVSLLMFYALNLDLKKGGMPSPVISGNQMRLTFYGGSAGVSYKVETSTDLKNWTTDGVTLSAPDTNNLRTATVPSSAASRYMRVVVSY